MMILDRFFEDFIASRSIWSFAGGRIAARFAAPVSIDVQAGPFLMGAGRFQVHPLVRGGRAR